jgi:hypothetical protein
MARRDRHLLIALAAAAAAALLTLTGALVLAPALVLLVPLLSGRYVGERAIERLATRFAPAPKRRRATAPLAARPTAVVAVRPWRLLAAQVSRRGPPQFLLAG